ncbi:threonylcarbamoyl-AMP synthase [Peribacillus muralis]
MFKMNTKVWVVDKNVDNLQSYPQITESAELLKADQVVAFPTETVYGLGANAKSDEAVKKVFEAKGRPSDNPLIVHIASEDQLVEIVEDISKQARRLMAEFWPGPLTLIMKRKPGKLSNIVTAGLDTVAVRMPDHQVALGIIRASDLPIAAPSANTSGKPSPTSAKHVEDDLFGRIAGIVDGGATGVGVESTVLDCTVEVPVILRPGGVTLEQLKAVIGDVQQDVALKNQDTAPKAPGMKYTHYAPKAPLYLVKGHPAFLQRLVDEKRRDGLKVGVISALEHEAEYAADYVVAPGSLADLHTVAAGLYDALRQFDELDVDIIFSESFPESGIGAAVMNRLEKAAGHQIIDEEHV